MIYKYLLSLLLLSFIFNQDYPEIGSSNSLDILTWNIENFPKHNSTADYLIDIIDDINIDIIALQEIESQSDFNNLVNNLNGDWIGYRSENTNYGELSYLINLEQATIIQPPYTILNQYEHYFAYRPPYVLEIEINNQEYILVNIHFKCCGDGNLDDGNYWDEEYRRQQASRYVK